MEDEEDDRDGQERTMDGELKVEKMIYIIYILYTDTQSVLYI